MTAAEVQAWIVATVDEAPELSPAQRDRLAVLLAPVQSEVAA